MDHELPAYTPAPMEDDSQLLFDQNLIHSIENEIDLDLVEEIAQDFEWSSGNLADVEDHTEKDDDLLDGASFEDLFLGLEDEKCDGREEVVLPSVEPDQLTHLRDQEPFSRQPPSEHGLQHTRTHENKHNDAKALNMTQPKIPSIPKNPALFSNFKDPIATKLKNHTKKIDVQSTNTTSSSKSETKQDSDKNEKLSYGEPKPKTSTNRIAELVSSSIQKQQPDEEESKLESSGKSCHDAKEARRRRMNLMLQRKLGRYHQRERNRNTRQDYNLILDQEVAKASAKAAVAAVLTTSKEMNFEEVVKIARGLLVESMSQLSAGDSNSKPLKTRGIITAVPSPVKSGSSSPRPLVVTSGPQKLGRKADGKKKIDVPSSVPSVLPEKADSCASSSSCKSTSLLSPKSDAKQMSPTTTTSESSIISEPKSKRQASSTKKPLPSKNSPQVEKDKGEQSKSTGNANKTPDNGETSKKSNDSINGMELPDGDDAESRRQRRLIRNRMSAQLHRERKREAMDNLKKEIQERDDQILTLRNELDQALAKNSSLESSLDVIRLHFGSSVIDHILNSANHNIPGAVSPPSSPPHLVNSSGSDLSEDDSTSTPSSSFPISPEHEFTEHGKSAIPSKVLSYTPASNRKRSAPTKVSENNKNASTKKKKKPNGLLLMGSLAICALLGCMAVLSPLSRREDTMEMQQQQHKPPFAVTNWHPSEWSAPYDEQDVYVERDEDLRRRLLSVTTSSGESLYEQISSSEGNSGKERDYILSPIETYPSMWKVNHAHPKSSPWTVRNSHSLFDIRSAALGSVSSDATSLSTFSMAALTALLSSRYQTNPLPSFEKEEAKTTPVMNTTKDQSPKVRLRGSASRKKTDYMDEGESNTTKFSSSLSIAQLYDANRVPVRDEQPGIGSSFMFCPAAYASLSPEFLELSGLGEIDSLFNDDWQNGKEKMENVDYGSSNTFSREDGEKGHDEDKSDASERMAKFKSESTFGTNQFTSEGSPHPDPEESKALVPSFLAQKGSKFPKSSERPVVKTILGGDDPYMTILLPASTFVGGVIEGINNESAPWVELGCHVLSARLVDGVEFASDDDKKEEEEEEQGTEYLEEEEDSADLFADIDSEDVITTL